MRYWFTRRANGTVFAHVEGYPFLQEVLEDGLAPFEVLPLADGPDTANITHAVETLRMALRCRRDMTICPGNTSFLAMRGGRVLADIDYEDPEPGRGDDIDPDELLRLLVAYRREVVAVWCADLRESGQDLKPASDRA